MLKLGYFLPQFKPTKENDRHWGKGFTEWTNVEKARPLFKGHKQPINPLDLGMYRLDNDKAFEEVINHTKRYLDGIIYWHYWFNEETRTLEEMERWHSTAANIGQKFCLAWANSDWTHSWVGNDKEIIFEQSYSDKSCRKHADYLAEVFSSENYVKIRNKPLFQVNSYDNHSIQYITNLAQLLREEHGVECIFLLPFKAKAKSNFDFEVKYYLYPPGDLWSYNFAFKFKRLLYLYNLAKGPIRILNRSYIKSLKIYVFFMRYLGIKPIMSVLAGWDNTPRYKEKGQVIVGRKDELIREQLSYFNKKKTLFDSEILLIKSVNEWAEGNICEPFASGGVEESPYLEL